MMMFAMKPYPVFNFEINLKDKYLEQVGISSVENYIHMMISTTDKNL